MEQQESRRGRGAVREKESTWKIHMDQKEVWKGSRKPETQTEAIHLFMPNNNFFVFLRPSKDSQSHHFPVWEHFQIPSRAIFKKKTKKKSKTKKQWQ